MRGTFFFVDIVHSETMFLRSPIERLAVLQSSWIWIYTTRQRLTVAAAAAVAKLCSNSKM